MPPKIKPKKPDLKPAFIQLKKTGWVCSTKNIGKAYIFKDFKGAFNFMKHCAVKIDKLDHHPEWLNVYNKIYIELSTHDAGGVTIKDIELAKIMDKIAAQSSPKSK